MLESNDATPCSSGYQGAILASLIPGANVMRMLLLGFGILKDEATLKSMSRYGDYRYNFVKNIIEYTVNQMNVES